MSRRAPDQYAFTAIVSRLASATTAATYTEVPQGTMPPYVKLTSVAGLRTDTYGRFGKTMTFDLDAVTQGASQVLGLQMRDAAIQALDFQRLSTTGHTMLGLKYNTDTYFPEVVNAVKTHHHVATFECWTEQSSS